MFDPYHKWLGIPRADQPPTHYRLLGINPFEADPDVIANAADQRMAHVKQYQGGRHSTASQEILNRISMAKLCLLHPARKADYDGRLRGTTAQPVAPPVWRVPTPDSANRVAGWFTSWNRDGLWQTVLTVVVILSLAAGALMPVLRGTDSGTTRAEAAFRQSAPASPSPQGSNRGNSTPLRSKSSLPSATMSVSSSVSATVREQNVDRDVGQDREPKAELLPVAVEQDSSVQPSTVSSESLPRAAWESRARLIVAVSGGETKSTETRLSPIPKATARTQAGPIYLDDLKELIADIGWGELGKHGATGYPAEHDDYGRRAVVRGKSPAHLLSTHPPDQGTSYVSYALTDEFRTFHVLVGILEVDKTRSGPLSHNPLYLGEAFSPLTFRVVGNGRVLWQSRPIRRSGEWQECNLPVAGVRLLELQVDCPGAKTFGWAAWADPRLDP